MENKEQEKSEQKEKAQYKKIFIMKKFITNIKSVPDALLVDIPNSNGKQVWISKNFGKERNDRSGWDLRIKVGHEFSGYEKIKAKINSNDFLQEFLHVEE